MGLLLTFITSGAAKWLSILIIVFGVSASLYYQHRQIVNNEKQIALQQYNITQLEQNVKDNKLFLEQMDAISKHKSEIVAQLYIEQDQLNERIDFLQKNIQKHVTNGNDRDSSKILKDLFKSLGEIK